MMGKPASHGDFEHAEVAVFVGKNPWQSHGFARTARDPAEIQKDPSRSMIVIDPVPHARPPRWPTSTWPCARAPTAWCLAAMAAILVQEDLVAHDWLAEHTDRPAGVAASGAAAHSGGRLRRALRRR
jgi:anaerobic selenocysteine-containing dehydrogenase